MSTLIYTCIYTNLWGTEFGGRPSREWHYRCSLFNILNLNADKFICFTSSEEIESLKTYFYDEKKVDRMKLEFQEFDLHNTKYSNEIRKNKDLKEILTNDRCVEIQYNKFLWLDILPEIEKYDKVYWFDAGLSHVGLFPEELSIGTGIEYYFHFPHFNPDFLDKINHMTNDKLLIVGKNNTNNYYWSRTIPEKYYTNFDTSYHIIGGLFGGNLKQLIQLKENFEELLIFLLKEENQLYHEEQILSCLYFNDIDKFNIFKFDLWNDQTIKGTDIRYFCDLFK